MKCHQPTTPRPARRARGFSLVEAAFTIVIVGVGFVALMQLWAACTQQNRVAGNVTVAAMLAEHVQEATARLPIVDPAMGTTTIGGTLPGFGVDAGETLATFDDVDDFDGQSFSPPIGADRSELGDLANYAQRVSVVPVDGHALDDNLDGTERGKTDYTGAVRVTVVIEESGHERARLSWIRVEQ